MGYARGASASNVGAGQPKQSACSLTPMQEAVLRLRATGMSGSEVAHKLGMSYQTEKNHAADAYLRLGVSSLVAAMHAKGWVKIT